MPKLTLDDPGFKAWKRDQAERGLLRGGNSDLLDRYERLGCPGVEDGSGCVDTEEHTEPCCGTCDLFLASPPQPGDVGVPARAPGAPKPTPVPSDSKSPAKGA